MPDKNKISFDYDGTLTQQRYRDKAKSLINQGKTVYIVTSRNEKNSADVYKTANDIGIKKENVHFTNGELKWKTIKRLNIGTHYDNNPQEIEAIRKNTNAVAIPVEQPKQAAMTKRINNFLTSGDPWAITDGWLEQIYAIANREHDYEALLTKRGEPLQNTRTVEKRGNVAIIPLSGVIFPRANMMTELSGATSLQMFAQDITTALNDPTIKAIIVNADSPGGVTTLVNETANMMRDAQAQKRILTYVTGTAASAAYYLAAGTSEIVMDAMASVGSIGVVTQIRGKNQDGTLEIVSSNAPNKRPDHTTDQGKAVYQTLIDDMESVFINAVANFRNLTPEQITAVRGGMLVGQKAVDAGFADRLGSLEGLIAELNATSTTTTTNSTTLTHKKTTTGKLMNLETLKADHPTLYQAVLDEGKAQAQTDIAASATNERTRIGAILGCEEAKGRETLAHHIAFKTEMSIDDAKTMLAASPAQAKAQTPPPANPFAQHMANINPAITPDNTNEATSETETIALAQSIAAKLNPKGK